MTSSSSSSDWASATVVSLTSVAIQWHISLHSGLSLLGASGSERAMVSCWELIAFGSSSRNLTVGCSCVRSGLIVLPYLAEAFFQETETVRSGINSSMTVGMTSAFLSLC